jgi:hypothetical protein
MSKWVALYLCSILLTTSSAFIGMSSFFAGNGKILDGFEVFFVVGCSIVSFGVFFYLSRGSTASLVLRSLNGCIASILIPAAIVLSPLLFCIFVSHGVCS